MRRGPLPKQRFLAAAIAAALAPSLTQAVSLNPDGLGQALIYPYYTVRSVGGNAFHTYLTVGNSTGEAKALRVRVREGRNGREALGFNLYLGPNDLWAAAMVPTPEGAQLLTADASCTDPPFANGALVLRREAFSGAQADGFGDTLDRTREGFVEILEMATLTGDSAAAIGHNAAGVPMNCGQIRSSTPPSVAPPTGGLWGTLTLINVNGGQDFTLDATALADLASRPYFRPPADPYPDFAAAEIDPVSVVLRRGVNPPFPPNAFIVNTEYLYRSTWSRPVDAVSAVLMSVAWMGEYVLDPETVSATDLVVTFPTRHYYVTAQGAATPFQSASGWAPDCRDSGGRGLGEFARRRSHDRETDLSTFGAWACEAISFPGLGCAATELFACAAAGVAPMVKSQRSATDAVSSTVFGSTTLGLGGDWRLVPDASGGWAYAYPLTVNATSAGLGSLPSSLRVNLDTGETLVGRHTFFGLPVVGFFARIFNNGQLSCQGASCQGTYGSAFPMRQQLIALP